MNSPPCARVADSRRQLQAAACADIDGSGVVGVEDLLLLLASYAQDGGGDTNGDGETNVEVRAPPLAATTPGELAQAE